MNKEEEIREYINQQIELAIVGVIVASKFTEYYGGLVREARREIIKMQDSQGVVIKVERELPENAYLISSTGKMDIDYKMGYRGAQQDMLKAGYVAVEPLIGE